MAAAMALLQGANDVIWECPTTRERLGLPRQVRWGIWRTLAQEAPQELVHVWTSKWTQGLEEWPQELARELARNLARTQGQELARTRGQEERYQEQTRQLARGQKR